MSTCRHGRREPTGRGRPGPGLKVDRHHALRLGASRPTRSLGRCQNYDVCGGENPAVVEVVTAFRERGEATARVYVNRYCVPCAQLDGQDQASLKGRGVRAAGGVYGRRRLTWLTTLVNGEVPT